MLHKSKNCAFARRGRKYSVSLFFEEEEEKKSTRVVYLSVHVSANSDMFSQSEGARKRQWQYIDAAGQEKVMF